MAETTGIAYVHHTRNFWAGCTKVGPGCDGCYAEAFNRWTRGKDDATGQAKNWGPGAPRISFLEGAVKDVRKWDRAAHKAGERRRVFVNTFADTFDNEVPFSWRDVLWGEIVRCANLDFLLVTKRVGNVRSMVPHYWMSEGFPENVRVIATIVNQAEAARDLPKLLALPCKNGVSYEPALEAVDWLPWIQPQCDAGSVPGPHGIGGRTCPRCMGENRKGCPGLEWIIVGGESDQPGHKTRPFDVMWARSAIEQCRKAGVPVFVKQLGSRPYCHPTLPHAAHAAGTELSSLEDKAGANPSEWPEDLRVQEIPA